MRANVTLWALSALLMLCCQGRADAQGVDTVYVSSMYTTHIHFPTDLVYADLSNKTDLDAIIVEKSKDVLAVKAKWPFGNTCNITAMESNGNLKSYILKYREHPDVLVIDEKHSRFSDRPDTVEISSLYTSHLVFSSELLYADLSDMGGVSAMILPQSQNVLALKARMDFGAQTSSVSALESDGFLHTYILRYVEHPAQKVISKQREGVTPVGPSGVVSRLRNQDAPLLKDVLDYPQRLFHLATKHDRITVTMENIFSYSDITYVIMRIDNRSGVSYEADRTSFVIGSRTKNRNRIVEETNLVPKSGVGTLTVGPGRSSRMAFTFDKITLSQEQVIRVCVYELNGRRDFFLTISPEDVNLATRPDPSDPEAERKPLFGKRSAGK